MATILSVEIWGMKKFDYIKIPFNPQMNIIVGENESGKSTILEAINIVLHQWYKNSDKSIVKDLLNVGQILKHKKSPSLDTLPAIIVEVEFSMLADEHNARIFWGTNNVAKTEKYGVQFRCEFDSDMAPLLAMEISSGEIPYEYYKLTWTSFQGSPYNILRKPINSIFVDTSNSETYSSFSSFHRSLFNAKYSEEEKARVRNAFRNQISNMLSDLKLADLADNQRFGVNNKKVVFDNVISLFDNEIALENRGKGLENIIKTRVALSRTNSKISTVLIEEPENHLSHANLTQMIYEIQQRDDICQVILTTHSNMIASRLGLNNIIWVSNAGATNLSKVDKTVSDFFVRADNNNFLNLLLADRVILVEGATEYLLLPAFYRQLTEHEVSEDGLCVISCNGISYKHYLAIAETANKKVAVITDNDKKQTRIDEMDKYNKTHGLQHEFMSSDLDVWTLEASLYKENKDILENFIVVQEGAEYLFHGEDYGKCLGKMLNNKVDVAYQLLNSDLILAVPGYVKEAIEWIRR